MNEMVMVWYPLYTTCLAEHQYLRRIVSGCHSRPCNAFNTQEREVNVSSGQATGQRAASASYGRGSQRERLS